MVRTVPAMTLAHRYAPPDLLLGGQVVRFGRDYPHLLVTGPGSDRAVARIAGMLSAHDPQDVDVLLSAPPDAAGILTDRQQLLVRLVGRESPLATRLSELTGRGWRCRCKR